MFISEYIIQSHTDRESNLLSLPLASTRSVSVAEWGVYFYNMTIGGEGELALNCI
jgi:hypothetical protein